ncbi:MAG: hypothetical protein M1135_00365 [Candidatus Omnitrophica bacterium]|nr:hypothetical protein [Candidatus Omnitrophota bacterium]
MEKKYIQSLEETAEYFKFMIKSNPHRNSLEATLSAMNGKSRKNPVFYLGYINNPDDKTTGEDALILQKIKIKNPKEQDLANEIIQLLAPLKMLNPITPALDLGRGTGTLIPSFGIPLNPRLNDAPSYTLTLDQILSLPEPDPAISGLMSEIHEKIDFIKSKISIKDGIYIHLPDMQGPFNIAHMIGGEDVLSGPYIDPEKFHRVMDKITNFWISAEKMLRQWIGSEWLYPVEKQTVRIAECSTNLVSRNIYEKFILPYDLKIANYAEQMNLPLNIHTCSGPHVFHETMDNIPNILFTEAGFIKNAVAGWTPIDEALKTINDRPIVLNIGQEIYNTENPETIIKKDFDLYEKNHHLLFGYTLMEWKTKDKSKICNLHRKMDEYWLEKGGLNLI